ncbi:MAG: branched-chain-amino-acid transaminase [Dethiobacter sp.]|jgi:branched-chain amino acid aminotransferase|nr:MAG: branched-chain-amino-acid transaminase [Dethiobacter sp.]
MSIQIYIDGVFRPKEEAKVSVFDHGYLYGDGVFEGTRAYNGRIFKLQEHLERLYESARHILLDIPLSMEEMKEATLETVRRNNLHDAYIRTVVSRGAGDLGLDPRKCTRASMVIIADKISLFPQEFYDRGLEVVTAVTRQRTADTMEPRIKSLNYLNNILVKIEAAQAGVMEAIVLNTQGYVVEGSGCNIFIINKNGELITPPPYLGILEGITRNTVIEIAGQEGLTVKELPFTRHDLYISRECFLTGTAAELIPVISIDRRTVGEGIPGAVTRNLMRKFHDYVQHNGTPVYP